LAAVAARMKLMDWCIGVTDAGRHPAKIIQDTADFVSDRINHNPVAQMHGNVYDFSAAACKV